MRKIPSLFKREFKNHNVVNCLNEVTGNCKWVLNGQGFATEKLDGTCCLIKDNQIYRRYDAKPERKPPKGAIPCQKHPDKETGHFPHWVLCSENNKNDKYHIEAFNRLKENTDTPILEGTYELIGKHFQSNPYNLDTDVLELHGLRILDVPRTYEGIKKYLEEHYIEGIVFWKDITRF